MGESSCGFRFLCCILFYLHNHSLLSYFSFFNYLWKMAIWIVYLNFWRLSFVICIYSIMFIFCYFTGCILHLSLIILLNKMSVFVSGTRRRRDIRIPLCRTHEFDFSVFDRKFPFRANLVKIIRIASLSWNLVPRLIRICRILWWWCWLFPFLNGITTSGQTWSKKSKLSI